MSKLTQEATDSEEALSVRLLDLARSGLAKKEHRLVENALATAEAAHRGHSRKQGGPYLVHPVRVAISLFQEFGVSDANIIAAALLHDVLEDAPDRLSAREIEASFGPNVTELVRVLTCPEEVAHAGKEEQARRKADRVLSAPRDAWLIKLADRIDNVRDACRLDDSETSRRFRVRYQHETTEYYLSLAEKLGNEKLLATLLKAMADLRNTILSKRFVECRVQAARLELDVSRMFLPDDLESLYAEKLELARANMAALERGDRVNTDENRQVGHYWLRNPSLAPREYVAAIEESIKHVEHFARGVREGAVPGQRGRFGKFLLVGIGGSALGPQMLNEAMRWPGRTPPIFFFDNTDPEGMDRTLAEIELLGGLGDTLTLVISKSGGTKETRNGMLVAKHAYEQKGLAFEKHAVAITERDSQLDRLAAGKLLEAHSPWLDRFEMWEWVGGRTSLLSAVGLLPAALLGFDIHALLDGAWQMDEATRLPDLKQNPALLLATVWHHTVDRLGLHNMVVLPYSDRLSLFAKYLQQLVMESLGKKGKGITVYGNKGSTDQHSYVQQLRDGRRDFFVTFIRTRSHGDSLVARLEVEPHLTSGNYLNAFQDGTTRALTEVGRLSMRLTLDRIEESTVASLVALFERAVGYYGAMIGINAYHQPGVEAGKRAAEQYLRSHRS